MKINFKRIEVIRKEKKISQLEICTKLDIVRTTYWYWKSGKRTPSEKQVRELASALKVSVSEISDLTPVKIRSSHNISEFEESWFTLFNTSYDSHKVHTDRLVDLVVAMQERLWQSSVIVKSFLSAMNVMFYVKNTNQKYVTANESFLKAVGLPSQLRVLNNEDTDFFTAHEAEKNTKEDSSVMNTGIAISDIEGVIPGSKKKRWGVISKSPILDSLGNIVGLVGMFIDITKQKENEKALAVYKKALDSASDAVSMCTSSGYCFYQNAAYESLFGVCSKIKNKSENRQFREMTFFDLEDDKKIFETTKSGVSWSGEIKMIDKNKTIFDVFLRAYPIKDPNGEIIGLVRLHTDISERKKFEQERRRYRKQLEKMVNERTAELLKISKKLKNSEVFCQQSNGISGHDKELNSFYKLAEIINTPNTTNEKICKEVVSLISNSVKNPQIACARIKIGNEHYQSASFLETSWKIIEKIYTNGNEVGKIEVYYLKEMPLIYNNTPFSEREVNFIKAVSIFLSKILYTEGILNFDNISGN